jgi:preprotein translocase subunit SecA
MRIRRKIKKVYRIEKLPQKGVFFWKELTAGVIMVIMLNYLRSIFDENKSELKKTTKIVKRINDLESLMEQKSDKELFEQTERFKGELKEGKSLDDILAEAFATVREVAKRTTGLRPYDVQLIGGILLH